MATEGAESNPPVDPGVVYILENEAFAVPVVKIGKTGPTGLGRQDKAVEHCGSATIHLCQSISCR